MLFFLRLPAWATGRARGEKCREQVFGNWLVDGLSVQMLEVQLGFGGGLSGDRHRAWVHLVTCSQCLVALQPCQEARESPGTQAFYRVDLSLDFAEMDSPVHWIVENFFQCVGE